MGEHEFRLTTRELEVLQLLMDRKTNREIANLLYISVITVAAHIAHIRAKFGFPPEQ